jgi:hypothetical protein
VLKQVNGLPWQRVLGSGGRISLRGEDALEQRFLLEAEGVRFKGRRVDMKRFEHHFGRTGRAAVSPYTESSSAGGDFAVADRSQR